MTPTSPQIRLGPEYLWYKSTRLHQQGRVKLARMLKLLNYVVFRALLPPEASIKRDIRLGHLGLGVVIHPLTTIGHNVFIWQGVNIVSDAGRSNPECRVVIEDNVEIGAQAILVNRVPKSLTVGRSSRIGAGAIVTRDVPDNSIVTISSAAHRPRPT